MCHATCLYCELECASHSHRVAGDGNSGVNEHCIGSHLHGFGGVRGSTETGIDYHRYIAFGDDDLEQILGFKTLVGADWRTKRHHGSRAYVFKTLAEHRVGLNVGKHHKAQFHKFLGGFECFHRVG